MIYNERKVTWQHKETGSIFTKNIPDGIKTPSFPRRFAIKEEHVSRQCSHDKCSLCHGSGIKSHGQACIHMISCQCPKCNKIFL